MKKRTNKRVPANQYPIELFIARPNYAGKKVLLGLSGGINSTAALCWLAGAPADEKPAELHLMTHQFSEHSDDTEAFVNAGRAYAHKHFPCVIEAETDNSVLAFFEESKMIPHPRLSSCTRVLKLMPTLAYMAKYSITDNPVGYVQGEKKRIAGMAENGTATESGILLKGGVTAQFPIQEFTNAWCLDIVLREIGWAPAIYFHRWDNPNFMAWLLPRLPNLQGADRRAVEKRIGTLAPVFQHNNCLPCKNMRLWQLLCVEYFYPEKWAAARATEVAVGRHWGRDEAPYYAQFGHFQTNEEEGVPCGVCSLD